MTSVSLKLGLLMTLLSLGGCYLENGDSNSNPASGFVSFESDVVPIFDQQLNSDLSCTQTSCHVGATPQGALNLSSEELGVDGVYDEVLPEVDVEEPESSSLLLKATNESSHTGGKIMDVGSEEYEIILKWITDGAFNDNCENVTASFATDVTPIFTQCTTVGCHDTIAPILTTDAYQNIQDADAVNTDDPFESSLLQKPAGISTHTGGTIFIEGVQDPDYKTIFCWIKNGAEDN